MMVNGQMERNRGSVFMNFNLVINTLVSGKKEKEMGMEFTLGKRVNHTTGYGLTIR